MTIRLSLITAALLGSCVAAIAQSASTPVDTGALAAPVLRANVNVTSDIVRIGDVIENAGSVAQVALYRAPDPGTTGSLPTAQLLAKLRNYQVVGVDTRNLSEVSVTRLSRALTAKDIERQIAHLLERRNGLGDADNLTITFDRELRTLHLDPSITGDLQPANVRFDSRNGHFDALLEIAAAGGSSPTRLRFTGTAVETVETVVVLRNVDRNEVLKAADVAVERRPKAEVGNDGARFEKTVGMQTRKALRAGQVLHSVDLSKPDLVQRDQMVTLIYEGDGIYLTMRAKAIDSGSEGDTVSVMNMQSKRTLQGTVSGTNQVTIASLNAQRAPTTTAAVADNSSTETRKAE
jgi:flagella basal body P-ring formation protein FlgA